MLSDLGSLLPPVVHERWPSDHEADREGRSVVLAPFARRRFVCLYCGAFADVATNFVGRDYFKCQECAGWTLHQTNQV